MYSPPAAPTGAAVDAVASTLLARTSQLTRLLMRSGPRELTRTEVGLLTTLASGARSITDLADTEALAQPTVSKLVDRLQARALVTRARAFDDGRRVLVSITPTGTAMLDRAVEDIRAQLRAALSDLPADEVATLVAAVEVLDRLLHQLHREAVLA